MNEGVKDEPTDPKVKEEPDIEPVRKPRREKVPSSELHIYTAEELSKFNQRDLMADAELLDGQHLSYWHDWRSISHDEQKR